MVRRSMEPSYDQSFDIKLTEEHLGVTFLTVQLKQSRLFAVKGDFLAIVPFFIAKSFFDFILKLSLAKL